MKRVLPCCAHVQYLWVVKHLLVQCITGKFRAAVLQVPFLDWVGSLCLFEEKVQIYDAIELKYFDSFIKLFSPQKEPKCRINHTECQFCDCEKYALRS